MEVEMKIRGLMMDPVSNMPIVVLKDAASDMVLPIWVGVFEANAIALEIEKVSTRRGLRGRDCCWTSARTMRPPGPLPVIVARSMPCSRAMAPGQR